MAVPNFESWQARWSGADWFHLDLPRHLYHFPLTALRRLLVDLGRVPASRTTSRCARTRSAGSRARSTASAVCRATASTPCCTSARGAKRRPSTSACAALLLLFAVSAPFALALSLAETLGKSGATVHVVATTPASSRA